MKKIGYWRQKENEISDLPWPIENSGRLPDDTKQKIIAYLRAGKEYAAWMGWSNCRICGRSNGSVCINNGGFVYPEGYVHYIQDHNVMPDLDLLAEVLSQ